MNNTQLPEGWKCDDLENCPYDHKYLPSRASNLPLSHQGMNDPGNDSPEVLLDEDGEPVDDDEDMFDYQDER